MRRNRTQAFALPRIAAELIDVIDGQRACERRPHPGNVSGRQPSLPVIENRAADERMTRRTRTVCSPALLAQCRHVASAAPIPTQRGANLPEGFPGSRARALRKGSRSMVWVQIAGRATDKKAVAAWHRRQVRMGATHVGRSVRQSDSRFLVIMSIVVDGLLTRSGAATALEPRSFR